MNPPVEHFIRSSRVEVCSEHTRTLAAMAALLA
jgi:hypothetical protein